MEERKTDKNSIIGFVLIGAILLWLMYNNQPTPAEANQPTTVVPGTEEVIKGTANTLQTSQQKEMVSSDTITARVNEIITAKNERLSLKISSRGAQIIELKLNEFNTYDDKPVYLIKGGNADFNISFVGENNVLYNTKDLYFDKQITAEGAHQKITLTSQISKTQNITFEYILRKDEYLIDFNLRSTGLNQISKSPQLQWSFKAIAQAKSIDYENRYSFLTYRYEDEQVSELSASSEDDDEIKKVQWIAYRQHFFNTVLINDNRFATSSLKSDNLVSKEHKDTDLYTKFYQTQIPLTSQQGDINESLHWYFGPTDSKVLDQYDEAYGLSDSLYLGWGVFGWLNKYVFIPLFSFLTDFLPHGVAIIILTVLVRLLMSPATYKSYLSQAKMKVLHPEIAEINNKFKGQDKAMKRQQETMSLYRKAGVNPMSGCIPAVVQLPVFYALFTFFPTAFALRQKSFLWAEDLSSYDTVATLPFNIPFYGEHVSLFPILASIAIFFYMTMTMGQNMQTTQQPGMPNMKFLMYLSPLMMLVFFNNYASGLSLYYFISNLITILIMLVIKNVIIDNDKIHAKIQENKTKPKKESKFQSKMKNLMEQAEQQKKNKGKR